MLNEHRLAEQLRRPHGPAGIDVAQRMQRNNHAQIRAAIQTLALQSGEAVLEIGPGNGSHIELLLQQAGGIQYTGVDWSSLMIEQARCRLQPLVDNGTVELREGEAAALPFADQQFDVVLSINTVYFWQPLTPCLLELWRVLRPGGRCCLGLRPASFMRHNPVFQQGMALYEGHELSHELAALGFEQVALQRFADPGSGFAEQTQHREQLLITAFKGVQI